jgi:hypothetical protein
MPRESPVSTHHSRTVPSREADATIRPQGEKQTLLTRSVLPSRERTHSPVSADHSRTVRSEEADASKLMMNSVGGTGWAFFFAASRLFAFDTTPTDTKHSCDTHFLNKGKG